MAKGHGKTANPRKHKSSQQDTLAWVKTVPGTITSSAMSFYTSHGKTVAAYIQDNPIVALLFCIFVTLFLMFIVSLLWVFFKVGFWVVIIAGSLWLLRGLARGQLVQQSSVDN